MTIVQVILHHEYWWFECYRHEHSHTIECFSPFSVTFIEDRFCLFRTWSFTLLENDPDSVDNSDSVSSFPKMNCCGLVTLWRIRTGCPFHHEVLPRSQRIGLFIPSCWVFSWKKLDWDSCAFLQEVATGCSVRSPIVLSAFHSREDQTWLSSHFE